MDYKEIGDSEIVVLHISYISPLKTTKLGEKHPRIPNMLLVLSGDQPLTPDAGTG